MFRIFDCWLCWSADIIDNCQIVLRNKVWRKVGKINPAWKIKSLKVGKGKNAKQTWTSSEIKKELNSEKTWWQCLLNVKPGKVRAKDRIAQLAWEKERLVSRIKGKILF